MYGCVAVCVAMAEMVTIGHAHQGAGVRLTNVATCHFVIKRVQHVLALLGRQKRKTYTDTDTEIQIQIRIRRRHTPVAIFGI